MIATSSPRELTPRALALCAPSLRAYSLAYASTTAPRLLALVLVIVKKRPHIAKVSSSFSSIITGSLAFRGSPTFCAALIGGYTVLQVPLRYLYDRLCINLIMGDKERQDLLAFGTIVSRFVAGFIAAWTSLQILNTSKQREARPKKPGSGYLAETSDSSVRSGIQPDPNPGSTPILSYGRTIDLTLLATTRAVEAVVVNIWRRISRSHRKISSPTLSPISYYADAVVFALSSGTVMWAWFYHPSTLPHAYNKWIGEAAQVDMRLIEVLRKARAGAFIYGKDTGEQGRLLQSMCKDYDWPLRWGDPEKMIPIPCAMVHMGTGPNCHWHAAVRFVRAFQFAFATNLPLQLLVKVIARRQMSIKSVAQACREAVRSSAFLGAFVALMYYGICLSRTKVGPKLFSPATITPQMWDSGICVRAACILCGWSILLEAEKRRQELAMFVAPRALATLSPRTYDAKYFWRERTVFALSTAIVFTMAQEDSRNVRGMLGKLLNGIL